MNVLIVDDSKSIVKMNTRITQHFFPDANIISFLSPAEALEALSKENLSFDFALLDYNMEGMDGVQLAEELVNSTQIGIKDFSIISIVSANIQQAVKSKATEKGMNFIDKPLQKEEFERFLQDKGLV